MGNYLTHRFNYENHESVSALDDGSYWSHAFAHKLLEHIEYEGVTNVLDLGTGTGFLSIELANRFGDKTKICALDPWLTALERFKNKLETLNIKNISVINGIAESMPFEDDFFDLIISNNGLNNVQDLEKAVNECERVAKKSCRLLASQNGVATFHEFYKIFNRLLMNHGYKEERIKLKEHIVSKRPIISNFIHLLINYGFDTHSLIKSQFTYKFKDANAFFNHYLIKSFFLKSWIEILPERIVESFFESLEYELDVYFKHKSIEMTVPYYIVSAIKI